MGSAESTGETAFSPVPLRRIAASFASSIRAFKLKAHLQPCAIILKASKAVGKIQDVGRDVILCPHRGFRALALRKHKKPLGTQLPAEFLCQGAYIQRLFVCLLRHQLSQTFDQEGVHGERLRFALFMQPFPNLPVCFTGEIEAEKQRLVVLSHITSRIPPFQIVQRQQLIALGRGADVFNILHPVIAAVPEVFEDAGSAAHDGEAHDLRVELVFPQLGENRVRIFLGSLAHDRGVLFRQISVPTAQEVFAHIVWHGKTLPTAQIGEFVVYDSLKSAYGMDSVYRFSYSVSRTYRFEETKYVNETDLVWRGQIIKDIPQAAEPYFFYDSLQTIQGCDSVFVLKLFVSDIPVTYGAYEAFVCEGEQVKFEGVKYGEAFDGEVRVSEPNIYGGDSIVHLTVTVLPSYIVDEYMTMTVGEAQYWEGWNLSSMPVGLYEMEATYYSIDDCDSTLVLHLTVQPEPVTTGLPNLPKSAGKVQKVLYNGKLYIIRKDEHIYDILGKKIK